jgi:peptide/nickel transport system permease protein
VLTYTARRLAIAIPTLIAISVIMFAVLYKAGDPFSALRGVRNLDPEAFRDITRANHLDKPFFVQYWYWLTDVFQGNLGRSFQPGAEPVTDNLARRLPKSLELLGVSLVVTGLIAVPLGVFGATKRNSMIDNVTTGLSYLGFATPVFFVGLMLQLSMLRIQGIGWGVLLLILGLVTLPLSFRALKRGSGIVSSCVSCAIAALGAATLTAHQGDLLLFTAGLTSSDNESLMTLDHLRHLVLPVLTISVITIASWSRYLRGSMLGVLNQDYLRTARAKGLSERRVVYGHGLRNGLLPLITIVAIDAAAVFSGAVITETIFAWDGVGGGLVEAVHKHDIPVAMAIIMLGALMVIIFNLVADVCYAIADPRIRLS